jgi:hypothetical protein
VFLILHWKDKNMRNAFLFIFVLNYTICFILNWSSRLDNNGGVDDLVLSRLIGIDDWYWIEYRSAKSYEL